MSEGPTVDNRWWIDRDEMPETAKDAPKHDRPPFGSRFFDIGYAFDQEHAKVRLTDVNLKLLAEASPAAGEWRILPMVPSERVPAAHLDRIMRRVPLPPGARGVIVDSGRSVRVIVTGDPVGERVLEFTFGEAPSFDCWIRGEWVREEVFRDLDEALRRARPLVGRYLGGDEAGT
jgi:hypothetical protein